MPEEKGNIKERTKIERRRWSRDENRESGACYERRFRRYNLLLAANSFLPRQSSHVETWLGVPYD